MKNSSLFGKKVDSHHQIAEIDLTNVKSIIKVLSKKNRINKSTGGPHFTRIHFARALITNIII